MILEFAKISEPPCRSCLDEILFLENYGCVFLFPVEGGITAAEISPAPDGTFSIVVISDTQYYLSENDVVTNPTFDT